MGDTVRMWAYVTVQGTAMAEAALCGACLENEGAYEQATDAAGEAGDWDRGRMANASGNDALRCLGCGRDAYGEAPSPVAGQGFRLTRAITAGDLAMDSDESDEPGAGYRQDDVIAPAGTTVEATGEQDGDWIEVGGFANDRFACGFVSRADLASWD